MSVTPLEKQSCVDEPFARSEAIKNVPTRTYRPVSLKQLVPKVGQGAWVGNTSTHPDNTQSGHTHYWRIAQSVTCEAVLQPQHGSPCHQLAHYDYAPFSVLRYSRLELQSAALQLQPPKNRYDQFVSRFSRMLRTAAVADRSQSVRRQGRVEASSADQLPAKAADDAG